MYLFTLNHLIKGIKNVKPSKETQKQKKTSSSNEHFKIFKTL